MDTRREFNPVISKIKLNPEQAVLTCTCVNGYYQVRSLRLRTRTICTGLSVRTTQTQYCLSGTTATANFT